MKSNILFLLCFAPMTIWAQTEKTVKTTVQKAIVYEQGAQLSSQETVSLSEGTNYVIFEGVSQFAQPNSLQASCKGSAVVMDVRYNLKYAETPQQAAVNPQKAPDPNKDRWTKELKRVQDSITDISFTLQELALRVNSLQTERNVMASNRLMRGEQQRDSLAMFTRSVDFLRQRLENLDKESIKIAREQNRITTISNDLQTRQRTLQTLLTGNFPVAAASPQPIPQIIVTVLADYAMTATIGIDYFINNAGWTAGYDLRATKEATSMELRHRASVFQNSGIDWKNIALTLSTGNPNQNNTKPVLSPFFIQYDNPLALKQQEDFKLRNALKNSSINGGALVPPPAMVAEELEFDSNKRLEDQKDIGIDNYINTNTNMLRVEYEIQLKYTIESNNQPRNVLIQTKNMPTTFNYSVIPKLDLDAFLMARITGWEDMNLVAGAARIYFDGSYVGESYINPLATTDTLLLNLGRDKSIVVTRSKVKEKSKEKFLDESKTTTKTYEITVRNTKPMPIRIIIEDQMPITRDNTIKIEYLEKAGGEFNENTGKLTWDLNLKSKDTKKLIFSYEIKHPKDKTVTIK